MNECTERSQASFKQECKNDEQKLNEIFDPSLKKHRKESKPKFICKARTNENVCEHDEEDQQYFDLLEPFYKNNKII